jgi:hypothetical protein
MRNATELLVQSGVLCCLLQAQQQMKLPRELTAGVPLSGGGASL